MKIYDKHIKHMFYSILLASLLIFLISIPLTHYDSLRLYLWKPGSSFYDFYTCLKANIYWERLDYGGDMYPPLAKLFYSFITRCMSFDTLQQLGELTDYNKIKALQECSIYFVIYSNVLLLLYYLACTSWKKGTKLEKNIFAVSMLFSVPFLYQFERANIIFLALVFTMFFMVGKDSENKIIREISYISLAIAAGVKLYPAIFGLLLIKERKYKEAVRLIIYGVLALFVPFLFFGGIRNAFPTFLHNLTGASGVISMTRIGCQLDYSTMFGVIFSWTGGRQIFFRGVFWGLTVVSGLWAIIGLKSSWKTVLLMTCLLIGIPSISYIYTAIFMIIPIIAFLDSRDKSGKDIVYLFGMLLTVIPIPFCWREAAGDVNYSYTHITIPVLVEGMSIVVMSFLLIAEGLFGFFKGRRKAIISGTAVMIVVLAVIKFNYPKFNAPFAYTNYLTQTVSDKMRVKDGDEIIQSFTAHGTRLDYIVLRMKPANVGVLGVKLENMEGVVIENIETDMTELTNGYNQIIFEDGVLERGHQYVIKLSLNLDKEDEVSIWRTVTNLDIGDEYFKWNDKKQAGALSVQFCESQI